MTEYLLAEPNWDNLGPTFLDAIGDTLWMVAITMIVGGFFGLVLGMLLYTTRPGGILRNNVVYTLINVAVNFFRPIPFIIMIAMLYPLTLEVVGTTIGRAAATFVMCFSATFTVARIVEQNLVAIDPGVIEAARSMGCRPLEDHHLGDPAGGTRPANPGLHLHLHRSHRYVCDGRLHRWWRCG